jgi:integrase
MARGSIVKRCPICRKKENRIPSHVCLTQESSFYIVYRASGKQKWEFGGYTKKDAERLLTQRLSEVNNGSYLSSTGITLNSFTDKWLEEYASPRIKPTTLYKYKNAISRHIRPTLGHIAIAKITANEIRGLMASMIKIRSPKTTNNILTLIKTIFKYARRWGYIRVSPTEDVDKYRVEHEEMDFLRPDEIALLLRHCQEPFKTLVLTAVLTGMRKAELLGLQWGDIDWNSNTIFVKRSLKWEFKKGEGVQRWYFDSPKTRYSVRAISMSPKLREALELHRIISGVNEHDLVFCNTDCKPLDPDNMIKRDFQPALRFAGLRMIRFHDLRHTYTSLLIAQKENIKFIQSQLGHASIQTTMDRYGHLLPVDNVAVGAKIDQQIFGNLSNICLTKPAEMAASTA